MDKSLAGIPLSPSKTTAMAYHCCLVVHWRFLRALCFASHLYTLPIFRPPACSLHRCFLCTFLTFVTPILVALLNFVLTVISYREPPRSYAMVLSKRLLLSHELS